MLARACTPGRVYRSIAVVGRAAANVGPLPVLPVHQIEQTGIDPQAFTHARVQQQVRVKCPGGTNSGPAE